MLSHRKSRKIVSNRTNVISDSVSYSATCFSYINVMTSFTYNAHTMFLEIQVSVSVTLRDPL